MRRAPTPRRRSPPLRALLAPLALRTLAACAPSVPALDASPDAALDAAPPPDAPAANPTPFCPRDGAPPPAYPPAPHRIERGFALPPLALLGETPAGDATLARYFEPCAPAPRLLVLRVFAAWSGPSRWHAAHTGLLAARPDRARLTIVDLLSLGPSNTPADRDDLGGLRAVYDALPDARYVEPTYALRGLVLSASQLPYVVLVDPRTMRVLRTAGQPASDDLDDLLTRTLAELDGVRLPPRQPPPRVDERFSPDQWDMLRAMGAPVPAPPPDPTNAVAEVPAAAELGRALFSDTRLAPSNAHSCASCHAPQRAFTDGRATAVAAGQGFRNTPSVLFSSHLRWQFWDGRADTLWAQALGPFENPAELASSRLFVAHAVFAHHRAAYTALFGPLPPLDDARRFPPAGAPGDAAWSAMTDEDRAAVDRVFANVGKAIAAFERTLRAPPVPLERYVAGAFDALRPRARDGLARWFEAGCIQCHYGPLLTDDSFHNLELASGRPDGAPDEGRSAGLGLLLASAFRADGPHSDARGPHPHLALATRDARAHGALTRGQFHTPPLRGVAQTGPWGHAGSLATLDALVLHYARVGLEPAPTSVGARDAHLPNFHDGREYLDSLVDALRAVSFAP